MQKKMGNLGGIFLLFLLLCAIVGCIQQSDTIPYTEDTIPTEDTISFAEDTISTEDTITWAENTLICTAVIDGDTFRLENGETVRLIGINISPD